MDEVGQFIDDYCERGPDHTSPATRLYEVFQRETGSRMSQKAFGESLRRRDFESTRITSGPNKGKKGWRGLRLLEDADVPRFVAGFKKKKKKGGR